MDNYNYLRCCTYLRKHYGMSTVVQFLVLLACRDLQSKHGYVSRNLIERELSSYAYGRSLRCLIDLHLIQDTGYFLRPYELSPLGNKACKDFDRMMSKS